MHLPARNCALIVSAATGHIWQRGPPSYVSSGDLSSMTLNSWTGKGSASSLQHIHSISRSGPGSDIELRPSGPLPVTRSGCAAPSVVPRDSLEWNQIRHFRKSGLTQVPGNNSNTEELLEKSEVQVGEQEAQPRRQVLGEGGQGLQSQSGMQGKKWPERMSKGNLMSLSLLSKV